MSQQNAALKLFDLLTSRDFDPNMLDVRGKPAADPAEAEMFSFEYRAESGKDYGTIVILLGDDGELTVFCADNVGRTMEGEDKQSWFAFLEQLKDFSIRNHMSFGIKNINRLRYSMQGQAAIKEGLFESWSGNRTTSWLGPATEARLMVKHKRPLGENDARFRYVESLYIETADGERFKLPFTKLSGGRAMLEHVRQGGKPYDPRGQHIVGIVEELNLLSRFRRANHGQIFEGDTGQLVEETNTYYENLQRVIKGLGADHGYTNYFESWQPAEITEQDVVIEGLKNLFVTQSIDSRIEAALPLLARIQQQGQAMKEANIFEAWANRLVEGTWSVPDTPEKQEQLIELMQSELPVGADATNATEELYDLLGDDVLFDQLHNLADRDANADCRELVFLRMQELSDHPDVAEVVNRLDVDADYAMNPPDATNPADVEQGVAEGGEKDRQWSNKDMERLRVATRDFDDIMASDGPDQTKHDLIKKRIKTKPMAGPKGQLPEQGVAEVQLTPLWQDDPEHLEYRKKQADISRNTGLAVGDLVTLKDRPGFEGKIVRDWGGGDFTISGSGGGMSQSNNHRANARNIQKLQGVAEGSKDGYTQESDPPGTEQPSYPEYQDDLSAILKHAGVQVNENVTLDESGHTFQHILNTFKRDVKDFEAGAEMSRDLEDALYDYYFDDMPYGIKKARSGAPGEWIAQRFADDLGINETMVPMDMEENPVDYAAEEGYGLNPTPAAMEDDSVHSVDGGMSNSLLQDDGTCNMTEAGQMCPVHGIQECWGAPVQSAVPGIVPTLETVDLPDLGLVRMQQLAGFMIK